MDLVSYYGAKGKTGFLADIVVFLADFVVHLPGCIRNAAPYRGMVHVLLLL
jgi:hypothetical protein